MVAKIAVQTAMISEFCTAACKALFCVSSENHSVVKPDSGKAMIVASLNAKIGSRMIGAYKNIR
jgi:hypothetical protein